MMTEDLKWMQLAIDLSKLCPPSKSAYSVGAIIVDGDGKELSRGYSRELNDLTLHAEESALAKLGALNSVDTANVTTCLAKATIYPTLEPCSQRTSKPCSCVQLLLESKIPRVVIAWREPSLFVTKCSGVE